MRYQKRIVRLVVVFVVLILAFLLLVFRYMDTILSENTNSMAIGQLAIIESLNIPIADPIELDNLTRDQVYALRQKAAMQYPWLLYTTYEPSRLVFSNIKDKVSWWGMAGWYYYGSGDMSASGLSKESAHILNPYLLISAEFSGLTIHSRQSSGNFWNQNAVTTTALETGNIPFSISPENLRWWPGRSRIEVTYNLSEYLILLNRWTASTNRVSNASFDLIAYNARDLNMNFIWADYDQSINVSKEIVPPNVFEISHKIQHNNDCGLAGECNTLDANTPEIQDLKVKNLPAKLILYLWNDRPAAQTDTPDLTYVINIK